MSAPIVHLSLPVRSLTDSVAFYVDVLGCELGRVRDDWLDVWFYGMQLTLQQRPEQVLSADDQGVRHFGVALGDRRSYESLVERLQAADVAWVQRPTDHGAGELSDKSNVKVADPSGNIIEIKCYADRSEYLTDAR